MEIKDVCFLFFGTRALFVIGQKTLERRRGNTGMGGTNLGLLFDYSPDTMPAADFYSHTISLALARTAVSCAPVDLPGKATTLATRRAGFTSVPSV
jgi:hypothetical protein